MANPVKLVNMTKRTLMTDIPLVSWKGQTFTQITSILNKNNNKTNINIFAPNPLKIYRKEIAANFSRPTCNSRASVKIDEFDRPGGSLVYKNSPSFKTGMKNTLDINIVNNSSDIPGNCSSCLGIKSTMGSSGTNAAYAFSPAQNALKRLRSSGMIKRQFDLTTNKPKYYVDNKQYLTSRNKTQDQNQYNFLIKGKSTAIPGTAPAVSNLYAANGTSICTFYGRTAPIYYKPSNPTFATQGAVSSSSHITRVKYNSITNSAVIYNQRIGSAIANELAYGVPEQGYTIKDILGYPNKLTPVINKYNGKLTCCDLKQKVLHF